MYFGESGKKVEEVFEVIKKRSSNGNLCLVIIYEIDSLVFNRSSSFTSSDPTDTIGVVNTVLVEMDKLEKKPSCGFFFLSN